MNKRKVCFFTNGLGQHSFFLKPKNSNNENSHIMGFGNNMNKQLMNYDDSSMKSVFRSPRNIRQHFKGNLLSPKNLSQSKCYSELRNKVIVKIVIGFRYSIFLTRNYKVFALGNNVDGATGIAKRKQILEKVERVSELEKWKIIDIFTVERHSFFITKRRDVYGAGLNDRYQLGGNCSPYAEKQFGPLKISVSNIVKAAGTKKSSLFLDSIGRVFECGQVIASKSSIVKFPSLLKGIKKVQIKDIVCGSNHQLFLSISGDLYARGANQNSCCVSAGDFSSVKISMKGKDIVSVATGLFHTIILFSNKTIYACGTSNMGQYPSTFRNVTDVDEVWCGSFQTFLYKKGNGIFSCGFGSLGSVGDGKNVQKNEFGRIVKDSDLRFMYVNTYEEFKNKLFEMVGKRKLNDVCVVNK